MKILAIALIALVIAISGCVQQVADKALEDKMSEVGEEAEKASEEMLGRMQKPISIDQAIDDAITVRNRGTLSIDATELDIYIDNNPQNCNWDKTSVEPGSIITADCSCASGQIAKVVGPANFVATECQ